MIEQIKKEMIVAMKAKDASRTSILKLALSELQAEETRSGQISETTGQKIIRKMIKNNEEMIALKTPEEAEMLTFEIKVLSTFIPQNLSVEDIMQQLAPLTEDIKAAGNPGMAMGIAMKHFKSNQSPVDSKDVQAALQKIRG